jgi:hypothetical protein
MMSKERHIFFMGAALALLLAAATGFAAATADPQLDWHVVAGGGGPSSGAAFQIDGTAGQAAAGLLSGDTYELGSGFWGGGAVTTAAFDIHLPVVVRNQ